MKPGVKVCCFVIIWLLEHEILQYRIERDIQTVKAHLKMDVSIHLNRVNAATTSALNKMA
jgi:hypothetical protein